MKQIGYYNYYNVSHRYSPDKVRDTYSEMVERYNSDELKAKDSHSNPYSQENLSIRQLDEKLCDWAAEVRAKCANEREARQYVAEKYFGVSGVGYTMRWLEPEKYAMMENDLNAICFGTVGSPNRNDPRLSFTDKDWGRYECDEKTARHDSISLNMQNLLRNNDVELQAGESLTFSFDPYSYNAAVDGNVDSLKTQQIAELLNNGKNSRNLLYYALQETSGINAESLNKFRAFHAVKEYTGLDLSALRLVDGAYQTAEGNNLADVLREGIAANNSIGNEFKNAAFDYTMGLVAGVASKGWQNIPDINVTIAYTSNQGFYALGNSWEA